MPAEWFEPMSVASPLPVREQAHPAQDEGAHERLAQLAVGLDHPTKPLRVEVEDVARLAHPSAHQAAPPGQHVDLAGELARLVDDDRIVSVEPRSYDLEAARQDHVDAASRVALIEEDLTRAHGHALGMRGEALDLRVAELREHLIATSFVDVGHGRPSYHV